MLGLLIHSNPAYSAELQSSLEKYAVLLDNATTMERALTKLALFKHDFCIVEKRAFSEESVSCIADIRRKTKQGVLCLAYAQLTPLELEQLTALGIELFISEFEPPFDTAEKISSHISSKHTTDVLTHGDLTVDCRRRRVMCNGAVITLRNLEFNLLEFLMRNKGYVMSRTAILEHVWDCNAALITNTVDVHVHRLRKKLIRSGIDGAFITTIPRMGYSIAEE